MNSSEEHMAPPPEGIERCIQLLAHVCQCRDDHCDLEISMSCQQMKGVIAHNRICIFKAEGKCPICKSLVALCIYHGKNCLVENCVIPFCFSIKQRFRQRQLLQASITDGQRTLVAELLLHAISSSTPESLILGRKIIDKESYATNLENNIFIRSESISDYYRLLAVKKWEIEMDIEERKTKHIATDIDHLHV